MLEQEDKKPKEEEAVNKEETAAENNQEETQQPEEQQESEQLRAQLKEQEDKYLRLYAEFDNFRRRNAKERLELIQNASQEILQVLLPVLDDFDRSLKASRENIDGLKEGIELVYRKFSSTLEARGLKKMEVIGKEFDAEFHEAITQIPVDDKKKKGKIVDVVEDGYLLNDKVIRFAKVVIGV